MQFHHIVMITILTIKLHPLSLSLCWDNLVWNDSRHYSYNAKDCGLILNVMKQRDKRIEENKGGVYMGR